MSIFQQFNWMTIARDEAIVVATHNLSGSWKPIATSNHCPESIVADTYSIIPLAANIVFPAKRI